MVPLFYLNLYSEAVVQQLPWSNLVAALVKFGGKDAVVPTTNIGSSTDQIVQPSFYGEALGRLGFQDAWRLEGLLARNIDVFKECASKLWAEWRPPRLFTHDSLLWETASHEVIFSALRNSQDFLGTASVINVTVCSGASDGKSSPSLDKQRAAILPELFKYAPTQPVAGWPELALREYALQTRN